MILPIWGLETREEQKKKKKEEREEKEDNSEGFLEEESCGASDLPPAYSAAWLERGTQAFFSEIPRPESYRYPEGGPLGMDTLDMIRSKPDDEFLRSIPAPQLVNMVANSQLFVAQATSLMSQSWLGSMRNVTRFTKYIKDKDQVVEALTSQKQSLEARVKVLEVSAEQTNTLLGASDDKLTQVQAENADLKKEIDRYKEMLASQVQAIREQNAELTKANKKLGEMEELRS